MKNLLKLIPHLHELGTVRDKTINELIEEKAKRNLIERKILQKDSDVDYAYCESCLQDHQLVDDEDLISFYCPSACRLIPVEKNALQTWFFNTENFCILLSKDLNIRTSGNEGRVGKLRHIGTKMIHDSPYEIYLALTDDAKNLRNLAAGLKTENKKTILHFTPPQQDGETFISIHRIYDDINESFSEKLLDAYITGNHSGIYQYKGMILNTSLQTIQYLKNAPVEIKSNNQEIRLFILLLENKGNVIEYVRIGKYFDLPVYRDKTSRNTDSELTSRIQDIKKNLVRVLIKSGVSRNTVNQWIVPATSKGFRLTA